MLSFTEEQLLEDGKHVTTDGNGAGTFVPLYHAIYCLKTVVLTFMSAKKLEKFCRDVEKTARCIGSDGIVRALPPGSHGDVRVVMRDAMMATANSRKKVDSGRGDGDGKGRGKGNKSTIVASVDSVLDVLVKTLMLRRQQVEENLKRLILKTF